MCPEINATSGTFRPFSNSLLIASCLRSWNVMLLITQDARKRSHACRTATSVTGNTRSSTRMTCARVAFALAVRGTILAFPFLVVLNTSRLDSRWMSCHSRFNVHLGAYLFRSLVRSLARGTKHALRNWSSEVHILLVLIASHDVEMALGISLSELDLQAVSSPIH